jgi:hypothetical protein
VAAAELQTSDQRAHGDRQVALGTEEATKPRRGRAWQGVHGVLFCRFTPTRSCDLYMNEYAVGPRE